jgi:hypothetical protein
VSLAAFSAYPQSLVDIPRRYVDGFRPKTDSTFEWNNTTKKWDKYQSVRYFYTASGQVLPDSVLKITSSASDFAMSYVYDSAGNMLVYKQYSDTALRESDSYTYQNNLPIVKNDTLLNSPTDTSQIGIDSTFYNAQNQRVEVRSYVNQAGVFILSQKRVYTYVAGRNDTLTFTLSMSNGTSLVDIMRSTYSYNPDSTVSQKTAEYLGPYAAILKPSREVFAYANKKVTSSTVQRQDAPNTFKTTSRTVYEYDATNRLVKKSLQDSLLANTRIYSYVYDTQTGNLSSEKDSVIKGSTDNTIYAYETVVITAVRGPDAGISGDRRAISLVNRNGSLCCILAGSTAADAMLEVRSVDGRLVCVQAAVRSGRGAEFRDIQKAVRASGTYVFTVRENNAVAGVARAAICR